ncbi:MAG: plasmid recombination protein [Ruminiclostridium sp.]
MSAKTISHCQGKGSLTHNNRTFKPKNVDSSRSSQNVTFVKIPISVAYDKCFAEAVERYNAKQKRPDRRIKDGYFRYVFSHAPSNNVITAPDNRKSFYEDVVQIGDKNNTGIDTADAETAAKCLTEYMQGFSERNPNFFVFNAVLHMDEATPHLHIDYIPLGHYKRWVDTQNGLAQALKEMGYGEGENTINRWRLAERDVLAEICRKHGIEIAETKKGRGYTYTVEQYKQHRDTIANLEQQETELSENLEELKLLNDAAENEGIESTKLPFNKRVVAEEEFQKLEAAKKTAALRKTTLDNREKGIAEKENAITQKEVELSEMIIDAERSYHKYNELADEMLEDSRAYHELMPKHRALEERCQKAESELGKAKDRIIAAVMHITDIAKLNNCMLVPVTGYEDLSDKAAPLHKTLANVIRRLCSRFVRSLGFDKEADIISKKAGVSEEALSEFKSFEKPAQSKRFVR